MLLLLLLSRFLRPIHTRRRYKDVFTFTTLELEKVAEPELIRLRERKLFPGDFGSVSSGLPWRRG